MFSKITDGGRFHCGVGSGGIPGPSDTGIGSSLIAKIRRAEARVSMSSLNVRVISHHRTESCHSQDSCQGQERAGHFALRHEPHAGYQNRQRADTDEGLVQACLASLFCLKPNLRCGHAPTVARQIRCEPLLAAEAHHFSETLNAVDQVSVELAHGFSYLGSERSGTLLEKKR